jgi:uroporphyrin-III C-methyltransferase
MKKQVEPRLTLVGAGPGDPDLITLKGLKALQSADVVLYDALVNEALLKLIPEPTPKFFVGKRKGQHALSQDELNELIIACAFQYGHVVRLKGGDPFVFGRGFEEMQAMRAVSIEAEYIPGISSAISVASLEGIPVTHRGTSESFWVITGTNSARQLSDDLLTAMHTSATLVILMGVSQLEKIKALYEAAGMSNTPVAVIQDGSTAEKKLAIGTMESIVRQANENHIGAPAIIVIGEAVRLHPEFQSHRPDKIVAHLQLSGLL